MSIVAPPRTGNSSPTEPHSPAPHRDAAPPPLYKRPIRKRARRLWLWLVLAAASVGGTGAAWLWTNFDSGDQDLVFYSIAPRSLDITVLERGNLESQSSIDVICQVDDVNGDGVSGTPIVMIVPNGEYVEEGQLIVEFASSAHQERYDTQILDTQRARALQIQAKVRYENQKTQNETNLADAQLQVDLAELALEQFEDAEGGTFQIDLQAVELQIQEAQANRLIEQTNLTGVDQLYRLGYRSSGELAQARLSSMRAERQLATALSQKKELVQYQYRKTKMELEGAMASAERALDQVVLDNEALMAQSDAELNAANEELAKEEERLARYKTYLENCMIYAPQSGMVAYAVGNSRWSNEEIREGAAVRSRQKILTIPNLDRMQVKTAVHESVLDKVSNGQRVTVRVDAFPDRTYEGSVKSVAVLPDQAGWMSSDTKVYETTVAIDEDVTQLKPGMTAVVEIHVDHLKDVLAVPVQAIVQRNKDTWCYVDSGKGVTRRPVRLGQTNDKLVHVVDGIAEGDRVVLNPGSLESESTAGTDEAGIDEQLSPDEAEPLLEEDSLEPSDLAT